MEKNEFKKLMLKQTTSKILGATSGKSARDKFPEGVIDLAKERIKRRRNRPLG